MSSLLGKDVKEIKCQGCRFSYFVGVEPHLYRTPMQSELDYLFTCLDNELFRAKAKNSELQAKIENLISVLRDIGELDLQYSLFENEKFRDRTRRMIEEALNENT